MIETRWWVLYYASALLFGNYFAFDLPAALNIPLKTYLADNVDSYNYNLNLFYSLYSLPNIALPFISGTLMDRYGIHSFIFLLSTCIVIGQFLFSVGISIKWYTLMHIGRFLFGVGGESLSVAQSRITTRWFKGKELALAIGVNLAFGRLGSVLNDIVSPHLAYLISVPFAVWIGTLTCIVSFGYCWALVRLDRAFPVRVDSGEDLVALDVIPDGECPGTPSKSPRKHAFPSFSFPLSFWALCFGMCFYYGADIPFNAIHSSFLESKWYKGQPKKASQIMAIPDIISAVCVPVVGTLVDRYGNRCKIMIGTGLIMMIVHTYFAYATASDPSPVPFLTALGFAYAAMLTFWPSIPLVVPEKKISTAFGIATSVMNATLFLFPLIVAYFLQLDPTYTIVELFFVGSSLFGILCVGCLWYLDYTFNQNRLERLRLADGVQHELRTYAPLPEESL